MRNGWVQLSSAVAFAVGFPRLIALRYDGFGFTCSGGFFSGRLDQLSAAVAKSQKSVCTLYTTLPHPNIIAVIVLYSIAFATRN